MGQLVGCTGALAETSVRARMWLVGMNPTVYKFFIGNLDE